MSLLSHPSGGANNLTENRQTANLSDFVAELITNWNFTRTSLAMSRVGPEHVFGRIWNYQSDFYAPASSLSWKKGDLLRSTESSVNLNSKRILTGLFRATRQFYIVELAGQL
jgi:hypothetical protein